MVRDCCYKLRSRRGAISPHASSSIASGGRKSDNRLVLVVDRTVASLESLQDARKEENRVDGSAGARPIKKEIGIVYAEMKPSRRRER